jgi:hypothetical protein
MAPASRLTIFIEPVLGKLVSVSGALAEFIKAAFPGQGAGQMHPGGFMAEIGQHPQGVHPRRACQPQTLHDRARAGSPAEPTSGPA